MCDVGQIKPNVLEDIRKKDGIQKLRGYFVQTCKANPREAINLINDPNLHFATLYLLENETIQNGVYNDLNVRNKNTVKIIRLLREKNYSKIESLLPEYDQVIHACLKWIVETGYEDDGLDDDYDEIIDLSVILMVKTYKDPSVVPLLTNMMFERYRKNRYVYDLIWAFFEVHQPENLILIADRLMSNNPYDVKLATKLLSFVPCMKAGVAVSRTRLHSECVRWLKENAAYLDYTGETFQQANQPLPYKVSYESKYLHKPKKDEEAFKVDTLKDDEVKIIKDFGKLNNSGKVMLSEYSNVLFEKDNKAWREWIHYPLDKQLQIARRRMRGGLL